jgi:hypothetical protein
MTMPRLLLALIIVAVAAVTVQAYSLSSYRWPTQTVRYYVNPASKYVSAAAAVSAVQMGAANWKTQTRANIELVYSGTTTGTALKLNYKNEVFFRNASASGKVAKTYTYWNSKGQRIDSDILFYEGSYKFFALSGCSKGIYVENVVTHEFGHMLGLQHSGVKAATMSSSMPSYCDRTWLTLETDDRSGLERAYPPLKAMRILTEPGYHAGTGAQTGH